MLNISIQCDPKVLEDAARGISAASVSASAATESLSNVRFLPPKTIWGNHIAEVFRLTEKVCNFPGWDDLDTDALRDAVRRLPEELQVPFLEKVVRQLAAGENFSCVQSRQGNHAPYG